MGARGFRAVEERAMGATTGVTVACTRLSLFPEMAGAKGLNPCRRDRGSYAGNEAKLHLCYEVLQLSHDESG